jgi:putative PIN family toxin of toxin-antitoxin system
MILSGRDMLVMSNEILHETAKVLRYPRMLARHRAGEERIHEFIELLRKSSHLVILDPVILATNRDPSDIHVMRTAIIGRAEILCTYDRDFFEPPAVDILKRCGITVLTDAQLLQRLRQ